MTPRKRVRDDNVIYANFRAKQRVASQEEVEKPAQPILPRSTHQAPGVLLLRRLIEERSESGRLARGRIYARGKHVENVSFKNGVISAEVQGSQNLPFEVSLIFPHRDKDDEKTFISQLLANPNGLSNLRAGEIDPLPLQFLLAGGAFDYRSRCSCPDRTDVCKHAVATAFSAMEMIAADPELLLGLRGLNFDEVDRLAQELLKEKVGINPQEFWDGGQLPTIPSMKSHAVLDDSDTTLLYQAMRMISYGPVDELRAVSDLEDLFDYLLNS
ncbi:MAG: hypothetical protein Q4A31_11065 [Corynebacterium sp.]|uniref:SWIM zinc finger family protein n=1 Tax=Corynebacterium sp. TaxID=1720 RepID=UPI0026DB7FC2|nr:hypothetical protein [Corynebacterium sp.]MDO4762450.1 hypothetical protein [Corynebacterium sp.]